MAFKPEPTTNVYERVLETVLMLLGPIFIWFALWSIFDLALEGKFQDYFGRAKTMKKIDKLKDHYIICGAGRVGICVADELKKRGKDVVIAEKDTVLSDKLREKGYLVINGTSAEVDTLNKAGIKNAKYLVAATGDDGKNILIILTAKELNPNIKIGARATSEAMIPKLKHAGAEYVVLPEFIGGIQLVEDIIE